MKREEEDRPIIEGEAWLLACCPAHLVLLPKLPLGHLIAETHQYTGRTSLWSPQLGWTARISLATARACGMAFS